ncbi:hypothetical protein K458DRAFT_390648 [Lentithecium fluviatile CBS 122367]|uniref:Uncharacterized protein n=1 Tax=Lentithecium fluviatile CBS 122367 TaxID=1168545 RepID=A0A6G1IX80_9PLEO|nr:hypothetical protein K458DRAFT_390648 [Lentithecium fluviatile CBS 122367]
MDDAILAGGVARLSAALWKNTFPGVTGWKRYFGAATVGMGVSSYAGVYAWAIFSPGFKLAHITGINQHQRQMDTLNRLHQDENFRGSLSLAGRVYLRGGQPDACNKQTHPPPTNNSCFTRFSIVSS